MSKRRKREYKCYEKTLHKKFFKIKPKQKIDMIRKIKFREIESFVAKISYKKLFSKIKIRI